MQTHVQLGKYDSSLKVLDVGLVDFPQSIQELENCTAAAMRECADADGQLASTTFFLSRTDADFLDISCSKNGTILILSDRISPTSRSTWSRLFRTKSVFSMKLDQQAAEKVIGDYFTLSRDDFENAYQRYLTR